MKKQDHIKGIAVANLTYCRLNADLAAVELELTNSQPVQETTSAHWWKKMLQIVRNAMDNELRKKTSEDLLKEKSKAEAELARFESEHDFKKLSLSERPAKLKSFLNKKLFKKDRYGLNKIRFALALILDDRYGYQRPEQSLQIVSDILFDDPKYIQGLYDALYKNFEALHTPLLPTVDDLLFAIIPSTMNVSIQAWLNKRKQRRFQTTVQRLSYDQIGAVLAIKLTVAQTAKPLLPQSEWEILIDSTLKEIADIRADAEYERVFGLKPADVAEEIFSLCTLSIERLAELVNL